MFAATTIPVTVYLECKLRDSIRRAKLVCHGHEDTKECRVAWDQVESIQTGLRKKNERDNAKALELARESQCEFDERACREYDV